MDIYSFINSRDVAEHCRKIGKEWTAFEMAVIITKSSRSMPERNDAFQEIVSNYPDMPTPRDTWTDSRPSLHLELKKVIEWEKRVFEVFEQPEIGAIYQYTAWDSVSFKKVNYEPYGCSCLFTTLEKTWEHILQEKAESEKELSPGLFGENTEPYKWHRNIAIVKRYIDATYERMEAFYTVDGKLHKIMEYTEKESLSLQDNELVWFEDFELASPVKSLLKLVA